MKLLHRHLRQYSKSLNQSRSQSQFWTNPSLSQKQILSPSPNLNLLL